MKPQLDASLPEGPLQLHPALTRLRRRLELCRAPLVRLWGWRQSGRRLLLRNLCHFHPRSWRALTVEDDLVGQIRRHGAATPHLWLPQDVDGGRLEACLEALAPGQQLFLACDRRRLGDVLPEEVVWPREWLLLPGEVAAMLEDPFAADGVESLMLQTVGWWGPLRWLQRRLQRRSGAMSETPGHGAGPQRSVARPSPDAAAFGEPSFAEWLATGVLTDITPLHLEILDACRLTACHDVTLWRLAWLDAPPLLQALEELVHLEGWLGGPWPELWSTAPWSIRRRHRILGPVEVDARRALLHRRLGSAAQMSGRMQLAEHHLARSDRSQWRQRLSSASTTTRRLAEPGSRHAEVRRLLQVNLLGLPQVVGYGVGGQSSPIPWKIHRALMTLAYLLLAPDRRASREELIASVWRGAEARALEKNFHPTMSTLRRALGGSGVASGGSKLEGESLLIHRHGVYELSEEVEWQVDVDRFRLLLEEGEALGREVDPALRSLALEPWRQAWRLYRGPLLMEVDEPWLGERRRRLHADYLGLLRRLAGLCGTLGQHDEALDAYRRLLLEEPFEESVHLAIMEIYGLQGRRDLVRRQFVRLQELLRSELGVEPGAASQERFQELMR